MHIKLIKSVIVDHRHIAVGDVVEVRDAVGQYLIRRGHAVAAEEPAAEVKRERPKRTRRKRS